jgi:CheY-like chemotaxis protein
VSAEIDASLFIRPSWRRHALQISEQSTRLAGASTGKATKVLIVDDQIDVAELASLLLSGYGFQTLIAHSALEALSLLENDPDIDAMFSDVMMPEMTGIELARIVNKAYPGVKVILTSGFTSLSLSSTNPAYRLFVAKPYRIERVVELLSGK